MHSLKYHVSYGLGIFCGFFMRGVENVIQNEEFNCKWRRHASSTVNQLTACILQNNGFLWLYVCT